MLIKSSKRIIEILDTQPISPLENKWLGQMCSIPLDINNHVQFRDELYEKYRIEIPIFKFEDFIFIRISINVYNSEQDIEKLINALQELVPRYVTTR